MSVDGKLRAHASPTKAFFIEMITRDISLQDCILDLLDNSVDGARRTAKARGDVNSLDGCLASVQVSYEDFAIVDNCGGISLSDAIDYAFHFGRRRDAPRDVEGTIGLYGIGMKRAIFKIGRTARIESHHSQDSFVVLIDVESWEANPSDWDFDIEQLVKDPTPGTSIRVTNLHPKVRASFTDPTFVNALITTIARDYAFVLQKGLKVRVAERVVPDYAYRIKQGEEVAPATIEYKDDAVDVRLVAGLIEELDEEVPDDLRPDKTDRFGWYVVCNDRVIVAGDKTDQTVWGNGGFQVWHNQYNGFGGFLFLHSDDPTKLPWRTTKREVDVGDALYLRALTHMKRLTSQFIQYTNDRKANPKEAREIERATASVDVKAVPPAPLMRFPVVVRPAAGPEQETIVYKRSKADVREVAAALGDRGMAATHVGKRTFDYFRRVELGK